MSLQTRLQDAFTRVGTEFKTVKGTIGTLSGLTTTDKTNLVSAINEVKSAVGGAGAQINDSVTNTSTVWSGSKTNTAITDARTAVKSEILGGAGAAFDTLSELKALLDASDLDDDTQLAGLTTAVGNRLRFDAAQTLTSGQKVQGNANLGSASLVDTGNLDTNYVTAFEAALV